MDGSSLSLVVIPIVVVISLAAWLIMVAYAASHPAWKNSPASPPGTSEPAALADQRPQDGSPALPAGTAAIEPVQGARTAPLPGIKVPLPRTEVSRPVRQPTETSQKVTAGPAGR
jgi:hypothetical protein